MHMFVRGQQSFEAARHVLIVQVYIRQDHNRGGCRRASLGAAQWKGLVGHLMRNGLQGRLARFHKGMTQLVNVKNAVAKGPLHQQNTVFGYKTILHVLQIGLGKVCEVIRLAMLGTEARRKLLKSRAALRRKEAQERCGRSLQC